MFFFLCVCEYFFQKSSFEERRDFQSVTWLCKMFFAPTFGVYHIFSEPLGASHASKHLYLPHHYHYNVSEFYFALTIFSYAAHQPCGGHYEQKHFQIGQQREQSAAAPSVPLMTTWQLGWLERLHSKRSLIKVSAFSQNLSD